MTHRPGPPVLLGRLGRLFRALPPTVRLLLCGVLLGALVGCGYGALRTPQYTATGYLLVTSAQKSDPDRDLGLARAYAQVADRLAVLGDAQTAAAVPLERLRRSVRTTASADAPLVAVSADSSDPGEAAGMANAVADALRVHARQVQGSTGVALLEFSPATKPESPSTSSTGVTSLAGAAGGALLGGLACLARPRRARDEEGGSSAAVPGPAAPAKTPAGESVQVTT